MRVSAFIAAALVALAGLPVSAQYDSPWPSAYEFRRELQSVGYHFAYEGFGEWRWGRDLRPDAGLQTLDEGASGVTVFLVVRGPDFLQEWPESIDSSATALMEAMSVLPVDEGTVRQVLAVILQSEGVCMEYSIPGGVVRVDGEGADDTFGVSISEGGLMGLC